MYVGVIVDRKIYPHKANPSLTKRKITLSISCIQTEITHGVQSLAKDTYRYSKDGQLNRDHIHAIENSFFFSSVFLLPPNEVVCDFKMMEYARY
jgi:hypothetical protein